MEEQKEKEKKGIRIVNGKERADMISNSTG